MLVLSAEQLELATMVEDSVPWDLEDLIMSQIRGHLAQDPDAETSIDLLETWVEVGRRNEGYIRVDENNSPSLAKAVIVIRETARRECSERAYHMTLRQLVNLYERGNRWEKPIALGEFERVMGLSLPVGKLADWKGEMSRSDERDELIEFLHATCDLMADGYYKDN